MPMTKFNWKKEIKTILQVAAGSFLIGCGIMFFINPAGLYTGGVTGLAQLIVNVANDVSGGSFLINLGLLTFSFQVPMVILGYLKLSKRFILYTILAVVLISSFLALPLSIFVLEGDTLASALAGGILTGLGNVLLFRVGASSGGTAILFQYVSIKTGRAVGFLQFVFNGIIIMIAGIQFSLGVAIYTILSQMISAVVIDKLFTGYKFVKLEIITDCGEAMAEAIAHQLPHTATSVNAVGAFSHKEKKIVYAVISVHEIPQYNTLIKQIDPKAFTILSNVETVKGNFIKKIID
jgi:uncharacterized membrane-anchored protein YitT (DUF2179 family)